MSIEIALSVIISAIFAWIICRSAYPIAESLGILDYPDAHGGRKRHSRVTPLTGGLAVLAGLLPGSIWVSVNSSDGVSVAVLVTTVVSFGILGFLDDRRHIRPSLRLLISGALAAAAIYFAPDLGVTFLHFGFLPLSLFTESWAMIFSVLCIVGLQNAVNMADGKNGLVTGMCLIWTALLLLYSPTDLYPLLVGFGSALLVAFLYNLRGSLFLGDAGSYSLSALIGFLAIYAYNQNFTVLTADIIMLWFLVPVLDCTRLIVWRVLRGRSPFHPDREHLHHYLAAALTRPWGVVYYLALVGVPAFIAFLYPVATPALLVGTSVAYIVTCAVTSSRLAERATV